METNKSTFLVNFHRLWDLIVILESQASALKEMKLIKA